MKSFNRLDLLKNFNILESHDEFRIHDKNVYIVLQKSPDGTVDLDRFYSRVSIPGYARCSLYYMLKEIVEKIDNIDRNTLIGISVIAPSEPRRNIESIKKTYRNIGFKNIECIQCKGLTDKEFKKMVKEKPEFKDAKEDLCQDSEICSAKFEKIGDILDMLKNCDPEFNRFENRKRPPIEYTDAELFDFQDTIRTHRIKYTDEELLNTRDVAGITRKKHHKKSSSKKKKKKEKPKKREIRLKQKREK